MKCVIFLLALYTFERVFADDHFEMDLNNLRYRNIKQMYGIMETLRSAIEFAIEDVRAQGISDGVTECWKEYHALMQYHQAVFNKCVECYNKAALNRNIKFAEKCYSFNVAALVNQANLRRFSTKKCITKYLFWLGPREGRQYYQIPL